MTGALKNLFKKDVFNQVTGDRFKDELSFYAEIVDIVMSDKHPYYSNQSDLGRIFFRTFDNKFASAIPVNPWNIRYPVIHEIVEIITAASYSAGTNKSSKTYYYREPLGTWNNVCYNPMPYSTQYIDEEKNYSEFTGVTKTSADEIKFGEYFVEDFTPRLLPYEGDQILQSRFGTHIRLGSTTAKGLNKWSEKGNIGDPILYVTVTKNNTDEVFKEDIDKDSSSLVMCESQLIPIKLYSKLQRSYNKDGSSDKPIAVEKFNGKQIIWCSDRLVLNARQNIILSAKNSIQLTSEESLNFDSKNILMTAEKVYMGTKANKHAAIGEEVKDILSDLLDALAQLTVTCSTPSSPSSIPINSLSFIKIKTKLQKLLSNNIFID